MTSKRSMEGPFFSDSKKHGPFKPKLILHGGAGAISRDKLPPALYKRYRDSLHKYLIDTHLLLVNTLKPANALDAACHAVSLMEDNPLFNCGRGSVFTTEGKIEMEASVAVTSAMDRKGTALPGRVKRSGAVSMVRNTRHPILLAKEVLLMADEEQGLGPTADMHGHVSGRDVEEWGWKEKGLERKPDEWFWTKWRWEEHRRGLQEGDELGKPSLLNEDDFDIELNPDVAGVLELPSQGTVGCVCLDSWGNLAAATSTGGLTNKRPGRIGDTPTVGAGFWAESWGERVQETPITLASSTVFENGRRMVDDGISALVQRSWIVRCLMPGETLTPSQDHSGAKLLSDSNTLHLQKGKKKQTRAVAMSGTGNGDSFLRTTAARTTAAMCRFSGCSLEDATTAVAGPNGELQRSAGDRWDKTGEGQGGIIAIEAISSGDTYQGKVTFDFNCGGMWRAWYDEKGKPRVMVFKEEYA